MNERLENVRDQFKADVLKADKHREKSEHKQVHQIVHRWISVGALGLITPDNKVLTFSELSEAVQREVQNGRIDIYVPIAVGILGLTRIWHVDTNTMIREGVLITSGDELDQIEGIFEQIETIYTGLTTVRNIPQTIDGNTINWDLEISQDKAKSAELLGNHEGAIFQYYEAIKAGNLQIELLSDNIEKASASSAVAVHKLRLGILTQSVNLVAEALNDQLASNEVQLNPQRTRDFAKMILKAGIKSPQNWMSLKFIKNIRQSLRILLRGDYFSNEKTA